MVEEDKKKPAARKRASKPAAKAESKAQAPKSESKPIVTTSSVSATPSSSDKGSDSTKSSNNRTGWIVGGTIAGLVAVFLLVFGILIYKYQSDTRVVEMVAKVVPYPAEQVNGRFISYANYLFEINSIKHYYLSQTTSDNKPAIDFSSADGKKKLIELKRQELTQLQQEAIIRQLAAKHKIKVSDKEVQKQVEQIQKSAGGEAKVKDVLQKFYGWKIADLEKKIRFQLMQQKVAANVQNDPQLDAQAKAKAEKVLAKVKAGEDFAKLAKENSQDSSAANGGDLGFFGKGQMVKPFEDAAFGQEPGQVTTKLVKTQFGYHIIKTIEFNGDKSQVHASHILIKTVDFDQYLKDEVKKAKVNQFIHP